MTAMPRRVFALGTVGAVAAFTLSACGSSDSADSSSAAGGGSTSETETSATSEETAEESDVAAGNDAGKHTIVFEVTSDTATTADITLTSLDANGNISQEQLSDEALPFSKTVEIDGAVVFDASNANVSLRPRTERTSPHPSPLTIMSPSVRRDPASLLPR